ncbi:hypothetical protein [Paenibacillus jiagnxiensis]|uniref:hypothetical protein n=1 Tax=Paenibacillus jiagnxiensis TaxID=3228926 RepID=UPI00339F2396
MYIYPIPHQTPHEAVTPEGAQRQRSSRRLDERFHAPTLSAVPEPYVREPASRRGEPPHDWGGWWG